MATNIAYVGSTNNLEVRGLKRELGEEFLNTAAVTVTIKDANGVDLTGETWPQTIPYVPGSDGDYILGITRFAGLVKGQKYTAFIDADASDTATELYAHWEFTFTAQTRTK